MLLSLGLEESPRWRSLPHGVGGQSETPVLSPGRHEAVLPGQGGRDGGPAVRGPEADVSCEGGDEHAPSVGLLCAGVGVLSPQSGH